MTTSSDTSSSPQWERWLKRLLGGFAALLLFAMMGLTFVDVILRYWFNAPVPGGFELTEVMLASLIFCGLPLVTLKDQHVSVDLFDRFIPVALHRLRDILVMLVCTICVAVLAWRMWKKANESQAYGDITSVLELPLAPVFFLGAVALGVTACVFVVLLCRRARGSSNPSDL